jgi:hypothetical protein
MFFPLRTSVELFQDPLAPAAHVRAKQGAVLFDELIFETGIYEVTMVPGGQSATMRSAELLNDDELVKARIVHEAGTPMTILMGVQPSQGVPAPPSAMRPIMHGGITRHYVAEWESVLRELAEFEPSWAKGFQIDEGELSAAPAGKEIGQRDFACLGDEQLLPHIDDHIVRSWTYKSFNRDAVIAEEIGATVNITARFWPMIGRAELDQVNIGSHALECFVANLDAVPWEGVIRFRDHAGAQEAREKLRDFEQRALKAEPGSLAEFRLGLSQEITRDFQQAWQDMKPSVGLDVFRQGLTTVASTIVPVVGPVSSLMETALRAHEHNSSWRAALMQLNPSSVS